MATIPILPIATTRPPSTHRPNGIRQLVRATRSRSLSFPRLYPRRRNHRSVRRLLLLGTRLAPLDKFPFFPLASV